MKAHTPAPPNKKLILHFDVDQVMRLSAPDKDLFVLILLVRFMTCVRGGCGAGFSAPARMIHRR